MNKLLFVIDFQNDFVSGTLGSTDAQQIIPLIQEKVKSYHDRGDTIIFTRDTHDKENYASTQEGRNLPILHCVKDTWGWKIVDGVFCEHCQIIDKETFGIKNIGAYVNDLVDEVEFVGVCTDICVVSNALILKSQCPELKIKVDSSCCAGLTPQRHLAALEVLASNQVEII